MITSLSRAGRAFRAVAQHMPKKGGTEEPVLGRSREKTEPERRQGQTLRSLEFQAKRAELKQLGATEILELGHSRIKFHIRKHPPTALSWT